MCWLLLYVIQVELLIMSYLFFFFFKQKTAYEMRISDWSSDVCSSDLGGKIYWRAVMIPVGWASRARRLLDARHSHYGRNGASGVRPWPAIMAGRYPYSYASTRRT